ncbi:M13 family metallopeptidase [Sphingomonas alba]|uniref:M13 family metallopeptidase n=1 Tax=Sphingomonas alba TaxID=2908208 RepID=A0ABT0RKC8_9SPHN|nr:M13 family metallopeptidase [Sphingomonas alba]MCL6683097.1 M13 family metallopeptidase [Sphingomonas alba]
MKRPSLLVFASALALTVGVSACQKAGQEQTAEAAKGTELGITKASMDTSVKPGDDFYAYANGAWMKSAEIPADRSSIGSHLVADQQTEKNLNELIAGLQNSNPDINSDAGRVKAVYNSFLDTATIDKQGMQPIQADLQRIAAIQDKTQLATAIGANVRADVDPLNATDMSTENLFGVFVSQALAQREVVPYIMQGGLGMPEREYYLSGDADMKAHQAAYRKYVADVLTAAGIPDAAAKAQNIWNLELKIAQAQATREERDDWSKATQIWSQDDFAKKAPGLDWKAFFAAAQLGNQQKFEAFDAGAIPKLAALVGSEPLDSWKDWLTFHQINQNTAVLPTKLDQLSFAFNGQELTGAEQPRPRDKRAIGFVNANVGDALGKLYTDKYFPASAKAAIQEMVKNIKDAFVRRIDTLAWMAPSTKEEAKKKVASMTVGVGYPDKWTDYSSLNVAADTAYANKQAAEKLRYTQQLAKIGKPLDTGEWWMNAQLVNAVNLPVQNGLNFPAAILQPPFYDPKAEAAFNYGAIGAVIGHEISHSFDDAGAQFDSTGLMRNWWTPQDFTTFRQHSKALSDQFDTYEPYPGLHVKGMLTLGENIADVAGLQAAYDAYHASLGGKEGPTIDGFTADQRFFLAYAQSWATKMREAAMRQRIATDGHAPGQYRALTVRNIDAWYKAFNVQPGEKLYLAPEKRVPIY